MLKAHLFHVAGNGLQLLSIGLHQGEHVLPAIRPALLGLLSILSICLPAHSAPTYLHLQALLLEISGSRSCTIKNRAASAKMRRCQRQASMIRI